MVYERFINDLGKSGNTFDTKVARFAREVLEIRGQDIPLEAENTTLINIPFKGWSRN